MKQILTLVLFAAPFLVSAQEQPTKRNTTPPTNEKSISEKGVSSTKSRSVSTKKTSSATAAPAPATAEPKVAPAPSTATATGNEKPKD